ncbi:MAG: ABC transporter ATP-binding protein [Actinomycetota bacterium]|nr:ABC transporter ATP-binding protein [Actinomycetota bacterium]
MAQPEPVLAVDALVVRFPTADGVVEAVRGVSWSVGPGQVLGIVGESGAGKSVSALAVMGLLPDSAVVSGSARLRGTELVGMPPGVLNRYRGERLAMIFQDPMSSLNPVRTVGWQLAEAVRVHHEVSRRDARSRAVELLELVGIPNPRQRARGYPHELSGGMRQRVVIAMAMANDPEVIIADEPTTALDVTVQAQILETLHQAREATGAAMVLITHDLGVVAGVADEVIVMYAGRVVERGGVDDVFYRPRMPYTQALLGSLPRVGPDGSGRSVPIPGTPPSLIDLPPGCPFAPRCSFSRADCGDEPVLRLVEPPRHLVACHFSEQAASAWGGSGEAAARVVNGKVSGGRS